MKYKLTYLVAFALSLVAAFAFKDQESVVQFFTVVSKPLIQTGIALSAVFALFTISGSVAALRRTSSFASTLGKTLLWGLCSMIFSLIIAFIAGNFLLPAFGFSISAISSESINEGLQTAANMFSGSPFLQGGAGGNFSSVYLLMLCIIIVSYIIGYFMKPDIEVVRPAYVLFNSITEVGFRYGNFLTKLYNVIIFFSGTHYIQMLLKSGVATDAGYLLLTIAIVAAVLLLIVYPLMHLIAIRFYRKNPSVTMLSSFTLGLSAMLSGSSLFTLPIFEVIARKENDIPKKHVSSASPLFITFIRVGVAVVSYILVLAILSVSSVDVTLWKLIALPFIIMLLSIPSGYMAGFEIAFVASIALRFLGISVESNFYLLMAFVPVFGALAAFIDTVSSFYGVSSLALQEKELIGVVK